MAFRRNRNAKASPLISFRSVGSAEFGDRAQPSAITNGRMSGVRVIPAGQWPTRQPFQHAVNFLAQPGPLEVLPEFELCDKAAAMFEHILLGSPLPGQFAPKKSRGIR